MEKNKHSVLITGAAGYVGAMLAHEWSKRDDVSSIIAVDIEDEPEMLVNNPKIIFIKASTADQGWQEKALSHNPDVAVNCAWQIRAVYGKPEANRRLNIQGSDQVFDFAFSNPSIKRFIHFSTVASYGAYESNTFEKRFSEKDPFRPSDYAYSEEKRISELHLEEKYKTASHKPMVSVVRPAAITGPRGRKMRIRFGLQSVLAGDLKSSWIYRALSVLVAIVPATAKWARQYVHEDDVNDIITKLAFDEAVKHQYEIFIMCPPGDFVRSKDFAAAVGKKAVIIPPLFVRIAFFFAWHLSLGKVPTAKGAWKSYSYPILVDGSKITNMYGYEYQHRSLEAFKNLSGRYESFVKSS